MWGVGAWGLIVLCLARRRGSGRVVPLALALALPGAVGAQERVVQLTRSGARNGQPFYSPNGEWISFVSDRSGSWQIWLLSSAGGTARQLTRSSGPVGWPSWTPDGDSILYYRRTDHGHRLSRIPVSGGEPVSVHDEGLDDFRPLLAANGRHLLFDRSGASTAGNHDLFVRDLRDHRVTRLTHHAGYDSDARWSPDGSQIAFHSDRDGPDRFATQVYVMASDGSNVRRLTDGPSVHGYPAWSPDGQHIAYTAELDGDRDVWIMNADGSAPRRVTTHVGFDGDPAWAPDGTSILFSTDRFGGQELAVIDVADLVAVRATVRDRIPAH